MQVFERTDRVNFVDADGRFVGLSLIQDCCEIVSWWLDDEPFNLLGPRSSHDQRRSHPELERYKFCAEPPTVSKCDDTVSSYDAHGGVACFRMAAEGQPDLWLILCNLHDGFYGHGFEAGKDGVVVYRGDI